MHVKGPQARDRIGSMLERIAVLEAALERCRTLADKAQPGTAYQYCTQIEDVAQSVLDRAVS
ncbi:MAG: hypothetical protein ACREFC_11035 [Stellaceae bacterium]